MDVRLQVAAVTETVEVVATPSLIDSSVAGTRQRLQRVGRRSQPSPAASPTSSASARCSTRRAARRRRRSVVSRARASATTPCRSTRPTTTCSDWQDRRVLRRRGERSRSASTPSRKSSWSSRLRRAAGLRWRRYQRHHEERLERGARHGVRRPQPELGRRRRRRSADLRVQGQAVRRAASAVRSSRSKAFFGTGLRAQTSADGFSVNSSGQQFGNEADVNRVLSILQNSDGYSLARIRSPSSARPPTATSIVLRDFNLGTHQLTVRNNYISALNDVGFPSLSTWRFPDSFYRFKSKTNSTVGQLNSTFGKAVNELRLTYTRVRDNRDHASSRAVSGSHRRPHRVDDRRRRARRLLGAQRA